MKYDRIHLCLERQRYKRQGRSRGGLSLHTSHRHRFIHPSLMYCNKALTTLLYAVIITWENCLFIRIARYCCLFFFFPLEECICLLEKYVFSNAEVFKLKCTCFHLVNKTSACWYLCWAGRLAVLYSIRKKKTPLVITDLVRSPLL